MDSSPAHVSDAQPAVMTSRRTVLRAAAWSAPVLAVGVGVPAAAASDPSPVSSDIRLSFGDVVEGSTQDVTTAVAAFIVAQVAALGPQLPPGRPVEPVEPKRADFPSGIAGSLAYASAYAEYVVAHGRWLADYTAWMRENDLTLEEVAQAEMWALAVQSLRSLMDRLITLGEMVFSVRVAYPRTLIATNHGPDPILPGAVSVSVITDTALLNAHLPSGQTISVVNTGGASTITATVPQTVPVGGTIFSVPLEYLPAAVTLNITGTTTSSTLSAHLLTPDGADAGNSISSEVGVTLGVLPGGIDQVQAEWDGILADIERLKDIYELVAPLLPELDWSQIISGLVPLP